MLPAKSNRNKKIVMMALQGTTQINLKSHKKRKELLSQRNTMSTTYNYLFDSNENALCASTDPEILLINDKEKDELLTSVQTTSKNEQEAIGTELLPVVSPFQEANDTELLRQNDVNLHNIVSTTHDLQFDSNEDAMCAIRDANIILLTDDKDDLMTGIEIPSKEKQVAIGIELLPSVTLFHEVNETEVLRVNDVDLTNTVSTTLSPQCASNKNILCAVRDANMYLVDEEQEAIGIELLPNATPIQEETEIENISTVDEINDHLAPINQPSTSGTIQNSSAVKRKRSAENQRLLNKNKRMEGKKYLGFRKPKGQKNTFNDTERSERKLLSRCDCSKKDTKVTNLTRKCYEITELERQEIFTGLWSKMNWDQRKVFVSNTVFTREAKRNTTGKDSRRKNSMAYHLQIGNNIIPVCKTMYLNTTGLGQWSVAEWSSKSRNGIVEQNSSVVASRSPRANLNPDRLEFLKKFINSLNKLPSHYCRKSTNKLYLEQTFTTYQSLYRVYKSNCEDECVLPLTINKMKDMLSKMNVSLFRPRKDQCDVCLAYSNGHLTASEYEIHQTEKNKAREEKNKDKMRALNGECHVLTMDVQAVKLSPMTKANALYYRTKLCNHNFTIYNLANNESTCNWFDETVTDSSASTFASFLTYYLESNFLEKGDKRPIIIYSDGCTAQNRNNIMSNSLLYLSEKYNVEIVQKYLTKGHTQMECDSVHSTIETALKNRDIYLPSDYHRISQEARRKNQYHVFVPTFDFFRDFGHKPLLKYSTIRPGRSVGDPMVVSLKALKYNFEGISYKLQFDEEYRLLPHRPKNISLAQAEFPKMHSASLPITERKFKDLQEIKNVIPRDCWPYYDSLPHRN